MRLTLVVAGRFKSSDCENLVHQYLKLAGRFAPAELVTLPAARGGPAEHAARAQDEALAKFLDQRGPRAFVTILDERGRSFTSREWAARIEKIRDGSHTEWIVAVGGAHGYREDLRRRAQLLWSLSPMTMAHELSTIVAAEQLYRGLSILAGHPYHND